MGTYYRIQAACPTSPQPAAIDRLLVDFNQVFSTYEPDSELSELNAAGPTDWVSVSAGLYSVLSAAAELGEKSNGAFDPTVGALVQLWGFGAGEVGRAAPTAAAIAQSKALTGLDALELREDAGAGQQIRLRATRRIDLSSLAKGRAVDELAEQLVARSCTDFLVDIGGEIRVLGSNAKGRAWRLAIEQPGVLAAGNEALPVLQLSSGAVATSGDYRNFREIDGKRYSHLIDPRTGYPITHRLASVTVWHPETMWADGYATLLSIVGPEQGQRFAEQAKLAVAMLIRSADGFESWQSQEFRRRFGSLERTSN